MTKKITILLFLIAVTLSVKARTIAEYFGDTRANAAFQSLSTVSRLDMIDYYKSGMSNTSATELNGAAHILTMNDTLMNIEFSQGISMTLAVLPGKSPVLMVIETLPLPEIDSRITFYDERWSPFGDKLMKQPRLVDWLISDDKNKRQDVESTIPFLLSRADYDPMTQTLTLTSTLEQYYPAEKPKQLSLLKPTLKYHWNGKKFNLIK